MAGINKAIIIGNLGNDVELRYSQDGRTIANLSVATSEVWTDKNSNAKNTKTEWHRIVIFGKLAEIANQYLHKGSKVYIEGKLQTRKWQDQKGIDRYSTEIVVSGFGGTLQMLDKLDDNTSEDPPASTPPTNNQSVDNTNKTPSTKTASKTDDTTTKPLEKPDDFEDDIPF